MTPWNPTSWLRPSGGQKMTADDQRAWAGWADGEMFEYPAFQRINAALGVKPFPTPPFQEG